MRAHDQHHRQVFKGTRVDKWAYRGIGPVVCLLIIPGLINPGSGGNGLRIFVAVIVVLALAFTWRGWRLGTVEISPAGLTAFGAVRRWHWAWTDLDHVEVGGGPLRVDPGSGNRPLVVHPRQGPAVILTSVVGKARSPTQTSWLAAAATAINQRIHAEGDPASS